MPMTDDDLPEDYDALKAAFIEMRAKVSGAEALIAHLQLVIAKMKRELYGPRSERSQRLIDQLELQLEDLIAAAGEAKAEAERANPVQGHMRRPTTRRKCSGLLRGRSGPGDETVRPYSSNNSGSALVTRSQMSSVTPSGWSM